MAIILDIETIAVSGVEIEPVSAPANYKDPVKIADYIAQAEAAQRDKAALYPWTAQPIALGWCYDGDEIETVELIGNEGSERSHLIDFWARAWDRSTGAVQPIVTFAGFGFDLPVLMARSRLLGVECPVLNLDKYRSPHIDLMQRLTWNGAIPARSLKWFAKRLGLDVTDAFSGKEIAQLYEDQNWDAITAHCASDVRLTRQLAERLGIIKARPRVAA